jgi:hypothetical protein
MLAAPIIMRILTTGGLPRYGYVRYPERIIGATFPASRWVQTNASHCEAV